MAKFTRKGPMPPSYVALSGLLVPERAALDVRAELEGEAADLKAATEVSAIAAQMQLPALETAHPRPRLGKKRAVFSPADVARMEAAATRLPRSSDRRKLLDALLPSLQLTPVGIRALCRVPGKLSGHCELLRQEMPNFREVIDRIEQWLLLQRAGDGVLKLPPILLVGSPGVGKTYFATRLAEVMRVPTEVFNMESATASWVLTGSDPMWSNGGTGLIFHLLVHGSAANSILIVDELDKANSDARYAPDKALYALLEPGTACHFRDEACRDLALDASGINWIITANNAETIAAPLRSRMTQFDIPDLNFDQRKKVVRCVYRDMRKAHAWGRRFDPVPADKTVDLLSRGDGSVRDLRKTLMSAFAGAYARGSRMVDRCDVIRSISRQPEEIDLASAEVQGRA